MNILNVPVRYVSNAIKDQLKEYSRHRGIRLYRGLQSMIIMVPYVRKLIKEMLAFMDPLIESAEYLETGAGHSRQIRTTFDYDQFYRR